MKSQAPLLVTALLLGCGGNVVVDAGAGGAVGTSVSSGQTSSSAASSSSGSSETCASLQAAYEAAAAAALMCNCPLGSTSCNDCVNTIPDQCGCDEPSGSDAAANQNAMAAYTAWQSQGACPPPSACVAGECAGTSCDMGFCGASGSCVGGC